jgi:hypothetical protein
MGYCNLDNWSFDRRNSLEKEIEILESTYYSMTIISKQFKQVFGFFFNFDPSKDTTTAPQLGYYEFCKFAWYLFLLLKGKSSNFLTTNDQIFTCFG